MPDGGSNILRCGVALLILSASSCGNGDRSATAFRSALEVLSSLTDAPGTADSTHLFGSPVGLQFSCNASFGAGAAAYGRRLRFHQANCLCLADPYAGSRKSSPRVRRATTMEYARYCAGACGDGAETQSGAAVDAAVRRR
jgi:hypothetical protein